MTTAVFTLPARSDTLPENARFQDRGCDLSPSCLACPLPVCKYDDPSWIRRVDRQSRVNEIFSLREEGMTANDIAPLVGVSPRTVHRVLRDGPKADEGQVVDEGPLMTLRELKEKSLFRRRAPLPPILGALGRAV